MADLDLATLTAIENAIYSRLVNNDNIALDTPHTARRVAAVIVDGIRGVIGKEIESQREKGYLPYEELFDGATVEVHEGDGGVALNYIVVPESSVREARNQARG